MMQRAHLTACVTLLLTAGTAVAQSHAGEWVSYRDAYRAMVVFDKYGGPKNLLHNYLQVLPRNSGVLEDGVSLLIKGKTLQTSLALDALGRRPADTPTRRLEGGSTSSVILPMHMCMYLKHIQHTYGLIYVYVF